MEKRQRKRYTSRCEIEFSMNGTTYRGISSNLSLNGLFIRTRNPFTADMVINLIVHFPNGSTSKLKGITRWAVRNPVNNQQNGMGIEIIEKDETFIDFVKSIIEERKENVVEEQIPPELQIISSLNCEVVNKDPRNTIQERRRHKRVKTEHMEVNCEMPSATYVKIINISKTGIFVKVDKKLDIGKKYTLKIEYENKVLFVKADVVWSLLEDNVEDANGNIIPIYIAGMQFTDVLKGEITEIISLIEIYINTSCYVSVL